MVQKPTNQDPPIAHLGYALLQTADERKENCIHCNKEWYVIHHEDGVCHECQKKGLPGRTAIAAKKKKRTVLATVLVVLTVATVLYAILR